MDIEKKQILIIQKIKKYQASNCKAELPFNAEYFSTYANNFGFSLMKYWVNKISFFQLTISFFKEFCSCLNINNYSKFKEKIIYIPVEDMPNGNNPYLRENHQRNCISRGLVGAKENDLIIISDLDEIPNLEKLNKFKK